MNELGHCGISDSLVSQPVVASELIDSLRLAGADKFDPVHLHFIDVLAHRTDAHQGSVKRILDGKLAKALMAFKERFEQAQCGARDSIDQITPQFPLAVAELNGLLKAGDFSGVKRVIASLKKSDHCVTLGDLARDLAQHSLENVTGSFVGNGAQQSELNTTEYFRNTWSKLSSDRRVTQALAQAPQNPGPINSHMLVLRSLALMRDISPDYLNQFTSYVDTLLGLDQFDKESKVNAKKTVDRKGRKKVKSRRG